MLGAQSLPPKHSSVSRDDKVQWPHNRASPPSPGCTALLSNHAVRAPTFSLEVSFLFPHPHPPFSAEHRAASRWPSPPGLGWVCWSHGQALHPAPLQRPDRVTVGCLLEVLSGPDWVSLCPGHSARLSCPGRGQGSSLLRIAAGSLGKHRLIHETIVLFTK